MLMVFEWQAEDKKKYAFWDIFEVIGMISINVPFFVRKRIFFKNVTRDMKLTFTVGLKEVDGYVLGTMHYQKLPT